MRGSPIRKSSDQRSVDSSPRLIAASYVLHRLLVPRHPPCALNNLATQTPTPTHQPHKGSRISAGIQIHTYKLARCSRPLCSSQRTEDDRPHDTASPGNPGGTTPERPLAEFTTHPSHLAVSGAGPFPQDPTACLQSPVLHPIPFHTHPREGEDRTRHQATAGDRTGQCSTLELRHQHPSNSRTGATSRSVRDSGPTIPGEPDHGRPVLLRKEVIQPHLPVRLPCYDFVPIADPAFDGSLHKGWATGFGCCRLS